MPSIAEAFSLTADVYKHSSLLFGIAALSFRVSTVLESSSGTLINSWVPLNQGCF
ncbi:hypothetical protein AVDCRST_MAG94-3094 [uncultured Leptolyngbya sp.]|uniref:Uncharacterized protein n=1 Tax=uncultured Leptolyngbya sp. TaxID=332963 RepID=A0A6J4MCL5_9CYAN|nr:hypothetical protein AVDCRST_MAG94-3094 [uncultured Leptolyngbya sp.]